MKNKNLLFVAGAVLAVAGAAFLTPSRPQPEQKSDRRALRSMLRRQWHPGEEVVDGAAVYH